MKQLNWIFLLNFEGDSDGRLSSAPTENEVVSL